MRTFPYAAVGVAAMLILILHAPIHAQASVSPAAPHVRALTADARALIWIAVPRGTRVPRLRTPPLRAVNVSPALFELGVEVHHIEGHRLNIYSVARTIADCFRFRNTIGLDVALEALSEAWRGKRLNLGELNRIAKRLRVQRVMQPYLETVVL